MNKEFLKLVDQVHSRMMRRVAEMSGEKQELVEDLAIVSALRDLVHSDMAESSPEPPKAKPPVQRRRKKLEPPPGEAEILMGEGSPSQPTK